MVVYVIQIVLDFFLSRIFYMKKRLKDALHIHPDIHMLFNKEQRDRFQTRRLHQDVVISST